MSQDAPFTWRYLRTALLPARALLPASYVVAKKVDFPKEKGERTVSGTVVVQPLSLDRDIFRLGLPLFSVNYKGENLEGYADPCENPIGLVYPFVEAAALLWQRYGVNLAAFGCWEEFCDTDNATLPKEEQHDAALAFFGCAFKTYNDLFCEFIDELPCPPNIETTETYVSTDCIALLVGMLARKVGLGFEPFDPAQHSPTNPFLDIAIRYPDARSGSDIGEAIFFEGPSLEHIATVPLLGLQNKRLKAYQELLRLRDEVARLNREIIDVYVKGSQEADKRGKDAAAQFHAGWNWGSKYRPLEELISKARQAHIHFIRELRKDSDSIIEGSRRFAEARSNDEARDKLLSRTRATYTSLADVGSEAFAHMTVLPAGVDVQVVPFREAALGIAGLRIERPDFRTASTRQIEMRELYQRENGLPSLMDAANTALRMPGLFAVGYVGFAKLAKDANAHERLENIETLATDFWCAINPPEVSSDIRTDGLENWWKKKHRSKQNPVEFTATEAFVRLALFLNDVGIPISTPKRTGVISGIIQLGAVEAVQRNGGNVAAIKWRPNPELSRFITGGEGVTPHYMVVNHAAMFGYGGTERNLCPAMQLWCEHRTRAAYFSGNLQKFEGWLVTPGQDGTQLGTIAERMGFPNGRYPSEAVRRIKTGLETLQKAGVVSEIRWEMERRNAFEQQVKIRMSADYLPLYDGARLKAEVKKHAEFLAAPFAPQKRARKAV